MYIEQLVCQLEKAAKEARKTAELYGLAAEELQRMAGDYERSEWMTVKEISALLKVSKQTVYNALKEGKLEADWTFRTPRIPVTQFKAGPMERLYKVATRGGSEDDPEEDWVARLRREIFQEG